MKYLIGVGLDPVFQTPPLGGMIELEARDRKAQCTIGDHRRTTRWQHEALLEAMQARLEKMPGAARVRRQTAEHVLGTLKAWMGASHPRSSKLGWLSKARATALHEQY
jgi:hypothetical protein